MTTKGNTGTWVLGAAVLATGLLAGFFWAYAVSVMPGLSDATERTFVEANQRTIEATNESPTFLLLLLLAPALVVWALVLEARAGSRGAAGLLVAALVLYVACMIITGAIHLPLNDEIVAAGDPAGIDDLGRVADDFEGPWVGWHVVRTVALVGSFAALVGAALKR